MALKRSASCDLGSGGAELGALDGRSRHERAGQTPAGTSPSLFHQRDAACVDTGLNDVHRAASLTRTIVEHTYSDDHSRRE